MTKLSDHFPCCLAPERCQRTVMFFILSWKRCNKYKLCKGTFHLSSRASMSNLFPKVIGRIFLFTVGVWHSKPTLSPQNSGRASLAPGLCFASVYLSVLYFSLKYFSFQLSNLCSVFLLRFRFKILFPLRISPWLISSYSTSPLLEAPVCRLYCELFFN